MNKRGRLVKVVIAILAAVFLSGIFSGFMLSYVRSSVQTSNTVSNIGTLKAIGVGVYWDAGLTNRTTAINWGILEAGSQRSVVLYVRNEGNAAITLTISTANWNPSTTSTSITLTWNYNGQPINAGATLQVALTLNVSASIKGVTNFSFDTIVVGS